MTIPSRLRKLLFVIGLTVLFCSTPALLLPRRCGACGFHCALFTGNLDADWAVLRRQMATQPALRQVAIAELLRILQYVDTYNYAPDSPPWMATEEGREHARETAKAILAELGETAAPSVWQALMDELRFAHAPDVQRALHDVRVQKDKAQAHLTDMRLELSRFPELERRWIEAQKPREEKNELLYAWTSYVQKLGIVEAIQTPNQPRPVQQMGSDGKPHRTVPRMMMVNFGRLRVPNLQGMVAADPKASRDPKMMGLMQRNLAETNRLRQVLLEYYRVLGRHTGKGQSPYLLGSDMIPCDNYVDELEAILLRVGKPAMAALKPSLRHANELVRGKARELSERLQAGPHPAPKEVAEDSALARRVEIAVAAWDLGHPEANSPIAQRALDDLKARGLDAYADLLAIAEAPQLGLRNEALQALEALSGEAHGADLGKWKAWHAEQLEAACRHPLEAEIFIVPTRPVHLDPPAEPEPSVTKPEEKGLQEELKAVLQPQKEPAPKEEAPATEPERKEEEKKPALPELDTEDADRNRYDP